jgi:hypothetical protein
MRSRRWLADRGKGSGEKKTRLYRDSVARGEGNPEESETGFVTVRVPVGRDTGLKKEVAADSRVLSGRD